MKVAVAVACAMMAVLSFGVPAHAADAVPVYRLRNVWDGQHLITTDGGEYANLLADGWFGEGIKFSCPSTGSDVYRLYNPTNGDHLYTADPEEYEDLQGVGWIGEGAKLHSAPEGSGSAVYRLYNPYMKAAGGLGSHLWTPNADEYESLYRIGWKQEGVAWYALSSEVGTISGSVSHGADAPAGDTEVLVEVYDGLGNRLASSDASSGRYSVDLVPGTYRIAAYYTTYDYGNVYVPDHEDLGPFRLSTNATVRYYQRSVTVSSRQTKSENFDFTRFTAGRSDTGELKYVENLVRMNPSYTLDCSCSVTGKIPGGRTFTYTPSKFFYSREYDQSRVFGVRNGLFYFQDDDQCSFGKHMTAIDLMTGKPAWTSSGYSFGGGHVVRNDYKGGVESTFLPNGYLLMIGDVDGRRDTGLLLIGPSGKVAAAFDISYHYYLPTFTYRDGKAIVTSVTPGGETIVDLGPYL